MVRPASGRPFDNPLRQCLQCPLRLTVGQHRKHFPCLICVCSCELTRSVDAGRSAYKISGLVENGEEDTSVSAPVYATITYQLYIAWLPELASDEWTHLGMFLPCEQGRSSRETQLEVGSSWLPEGGLTSLVVKNIVHKL